MRLILMFDLPSTTSKDLKIARKWHNFLISNGFIMMTESVYSRIVMNRSIVESVKKIIKQHLPPHGNIQLLEITERQYSSIEYLVGHAQHLVIDSNERYIEI
jgi:CRISPR-associated protein Cas2